MPGFILSIVCRSCLRFSFLNPNILGLKSNDNPMILSRILKLFLEKEKKRR